MEKKHFVARLATKIMVFLPLFLSGCVTLSKSQENFSKQARGAQGDIAFMLGTAPFQTFIIYMVWVIGMVLSGIGGHYVVLPYLKSIKKYLNIKSKPFVGNIVVGCIERAIYTLSFVLGWYSVIIVILALKIGYLFVKCLDIDTKKAGNMANVYLLGNMLSLGVAILAGIMIKQVLFRI